MIKFNHGWVLPESAHKAYYHCLGFLLHRVFVSYTWYEPDTRGEAASLASLPRSCCLPFVVHLSRKAERLYSKSSQMGLACSSYSVAFFVQDILFLLHQL